MYSLLPHYGAFILTNIKTGEDVLLQDEASIKALEELLGGDLRSWIGFIGEEDLSAIQVEGLEEFFPEEEDS